MCLLQVILGGMIYDPVLKRGIRKKIIPEPNPTRVELPKSASLDIVVEKAKDLYFKDVDCSDVSYKLADSSGMTILIEDQTAWKLSEFYKQNGLMPSRHKLYIMLVFESVSLIIMIVNLLNISFALILGK